MQFEIANDTYISISCFFNECLQDDQVNLQCWKHLKYEILIFQFYRHKTFLATTEEDCFEEGFYYEIEISASASFINVSSI